MERDPADAAARREAASRAIRDATGIDEALIDRLVEDFYARVRDDALIGPVFAERIEDWAPHLAPASRCLVPFTSFSEFNREAGGDIWFARGEDRPLSFFAGIWRRDWTGVRKIRTGVETIDTFAFLTCRPNAEVEAVHPKAMPVILTEDWELEQWMLSPWEEARTLQRPLPDGALQIVARGVKLDDA